MKKIIIISTFIIALLSCNPKKTDYQQVVYQVWGTECVIIYKDKPNVNVLNDVEALFNKLSASISTYDSMSLLSRINRNETLEIDSFIYELLTVSKQIHQTSAGLFDPTVQPLVKEWGFLKQEGKWIDTTSLKSILTSVGLDKWTWDGSKIISKPNNAAVDFNAIAPGYAADLIAAYLKSKGINDFFINNGGEIVLSGHRPDNTPWRIAINSPIKGNKQQDTVYTITNMAMATSGNYNNSFEHNGVKYGHTISALTGFPIVNDMQSATVLAKNAALADAHATVCMGMNSAEAISYLRQNRLQGYIIYKDAAGFLKRKMID